MLASKLLTTVFGKTIGGKIVDTLLGDRINPGLMSVSRIHFVSLGKFVRNFAESRNKNSNILDFGCGNMIYRPFFEARGCAYHGIDIGESPENNGGYQVYAGGRLPFEDEKFDSVMSTQVFEHLENVHFYASELERVTKKGGEMLITIAHVWEYHPYPKHYQNVMPDLIPLIFKESEIVTQKADVTEFQNIVLFFLKWAFNKGFLGYPILIAINFWYAVFNRSVRPREYHPYAGNILLILRKK